MLTLWPRQARVVGSLDTLPCKALDVPTGGCPQPGSARLSTVAVEGTRLTSGMRTTSEPHPPPRWRSVALVVALIALARDREVPGWQFLTVAFVVLVIVAVPLTTAVVLKWG